MSQVVSNFYYIVYYVGTLKLTLYICIEIQSDPVSTLTTNIFKNVSLIFQVFNYAN